MQVVDVVDPLHILRRLRDTIRLLLADGGCFLVRAGSLLLLWYHTTWESLSLVMPSTKVDNTGIVWLQLWVCELVRLGTEGHLGNDLRLCCLLHVCLVDLSLVEAVRVTRRPPR